LQDVAVPLHPYQHRSQEEVENHWESRSPPGGRRDEGTKVKGGGVERGGVEGWREEG